MESQSRGPTIVRTGNAAICCWPKLSSNPRPDVFRLPGPSHRSGRGGRMRQVSVNISLGRPAVTPLILSISHTLGEARPIRGLCTRQVAEHREMAAVQPIHPLIHPRHPSIHQLIARPDGLIAVVYK